MEGLEAQNEDAVDGLSKKVRMLKDVRLPHFHALGRPGKGREGGG